MLEKILFVDDEPNVLSAYKRAWYKIYDLHTAVGGEEGLLLLQAQGPFAVVISDQRMPNMEGVDFLRRVKALSPLSVRIMLTGNADQKTAVDAINEGDIFRFYSKPCPPEILSQGIEAALTQYRLQKGEHDLLEQTLAGSVKLLVDIMAMLAPNSFNETSRARSWGRKLATKLKIPNYWELDMAIMLAPIGLVTLPSYLPDKARKGTPLTKSESELLERAPEAARTLVNNIPRLQTIADILYYQNKGFDGSGFPFDSVSGTAIPLLSRLLRILLDLALVTRNSDPTIDEFEKLEENSHLYDPALLKATRECLQANIQAPAHEKKTLTIPHYLLQPGDILAQNLMSTKGTLLLAEGQELTSARLEKLRNYVELRNLKLVLTIIRPEVDEQAIKAS